MDHAYRHKSKHETTHIHMNSCTRLKEDTNLPYLPGRHHLSLILQVTVASVHPHASIHMLELLQRGRAALQSKIINQVGTFQGS